MRKKNVMRPVRFDSFPSQAAGCVQVSFGNTVVACSASAATDIPRWIEKDENGTFNRKTHDKLLDLAAKGIRKLHTLQLKAVEELK